MVERRDKMAGYVRRGEERESDVGVGVTLEVRLHRLKKRQNGGRKTGKDVGVCKARRGTRIRRWRRVMVEVGSARVKAIVRDEVERREKMVRRVSRGRGMRRCENIRTWVPP